MNVLYLEWNSYANEYVKEAFREEGHELTILSFQDSPHYVEKENISKNVIEVISQSRFDFVFSLNYFPLIAMVCKACKIIYISWTYDSPYIQLYSDTIHFKTNYAFVFDKAEYLNLRKLGISTVYYLPMAAPAIKYDSIDIPYAFHAKYDCEISMIGSMYSESKHNLMRKLEEIDEYSRGYIEALINSQKYLYGMDIIEKALDSSLIDNIRELAPMLFPDDQLQSPCWTYNKYFLQREVTKRERYEMLDALSNSFSVRLYTHEATPSLRKVNNLGPLEYYSEMPIAMKCSKINLNISLRSILSGIPLRAMDIMACGGFLLTNFQADFLDFFAPNEDYVFFDSLEDLQRKAEYYLSHEDERLSIAHNGYKKVSDHHSYNHRIRTMLSIAFGDNE